MDELKYVELNDLHISLGAKMVPFAGFYMPVRYSSDIEEHLAVRNAVGVFDVSHMGEFSIKGPGALDLLQKVTSNDVAALQPGKVQYSCLPNTEGGIVDDLLVYQLGEADYFLVVNASNIEKDWNWIRQFSGNGVEMENLSDSLSLLAVQGPKAEKVIQKLTNINLSSLSYYHFTTGEVAGINQVIISKTGYTGAGGFELYVPNKEVKILWNSLFEAGKVEGIKPIGLGARDTLRLEMGYCLYGNDIDDTTSPIEAGLGWITKFNKEFTSADLFRKQKSGGVKRRLIGFKMTEKGIPRSHYEIADDQGNKIGEVTSGTQSPVLSAGIGMGYVSADFASAGTTIFIKIRDRFLKAEVTKPPFVSGNV